VNGSVMEVAALNYGVRWLPERHPIRWAANVFPVEVAVPGWKLRLSETELKAQPDGHAFHDEGAARADLEPNLQGWAASAEVVDHIRMQFTFLDAEMRRIASVGLYGTGRLQVGASDFGASKEDIIVEIVLERVPMPLWPDDSPAAREVREYCLRPMRALRRPVPDSAYGLVTQLEEWAGSLQEAADRLRVSRSLLKRAKALSGWARQRKSGKGSRRLNDQEVDFLRKFIEAIVPRLQRAECGIDPGEILNAEGLN
jgi:hypothetical protein